MNQKNEENILTEKNLLESREEQNYFQLTLTNGSFKSKNSHVMKLITLLHSIIEYDKPVSKWELSTHGNKNGLVPYSWPLVHKLVRELVGHGFLENSGVRKINVEERKHGKKHSTPMYTATMKGKIFLFILDSNIFWKVEEKFENEEKMPEEYLLVHHIWWESYSPEHNVPLRKRIIDLLTVTNSIDIKEILLTGIIEEIIRLHEITYNELRTNQSDIFYDMLVSSFLYQTDAYGHLASSICRNEKFRLQLSDILMKKLLVMDLQLEITKKIWSGLTVSKCWPTDNSIEKIKQAILKRIETHHVSGPMEYSSWIPSQMNPLSFMVSDNSISMSEEEKEKMEIRNEYHKNIEKFMIKFVEDFNAVMEGEDFSKLEKYFLEKVQVFLPFHIDPYHKFVSGNGIALIKNWLHKLPRDAKLVRALLGFGNGFDINIKIKTKEREIYHEIFCHVNITLLDWMNKKSNYVYDFKIKEMKYSYSDILDFKKEHKILNLKPEKENPDTLHILDVLKEHYKKLVKDHFSKYEHSVICRTKYL